MDPRESIANQTNVSLEISKHVMLNESNKETNLVISPLSIHVVLSLISSGSAGSTLEQLLSFLRSTCNGDLNSFSSELVALILADGSHSGGPLLKFVNGVWIDNSYKVKPYFKEIVDTVYKAVSNQVDFQTKAVEVANDVNSWAEKETNGLIKQVLPSGSVDSSTKLILANALYFKGAWNEKFDGSQTKDQDFHLLNGTSVQVPFMTSTKKQFVREFDGFKVLGLSYKQGEDKRRFSMYFYLPDAKDGLPALVEKMGSEPDFLNRHLPSREVKVGEFKIPKFKISFGFEASKDLKELGVVLPFSGEADLSEMLELEGTPEALKGNVKLYVSSIFHKAFIEVNEEGTEAGAASVGVIKLRSVLMEEDPIDFVADHPFIFLIREDMTGMVLFVGHVVNPSQVA